MKLTGSAAINFVGLVLIVLDNLVDAQYVCGGQLYSSGQAENCYYMGPEPVTWSQAQEQCQSRKGWLVTCVNCITAPRLSADYLASNGLTSAWSGLHMADRRLTYDSYSLPDFSSSTRLQPPYDLSWESGSIGRGDCVLQTYREAPPCDKDDALTEFPLETTAQRRKKRQIDTLCQPAGFVNGFSPCSELHNFICHIPAQDVLFQGFILLNDNDLNEVKLFGARGFPFNYYFSEVSVSANSTDQACERAVPGGRALRVDTELARFYFSRFVPTLGEYIQRLPFSLEELQTRLFWAKRDEECVSVLLDLNSFTPSVNTTTWPCAAKLFGVCEVDKEIQEPSIPRLEVTFLGQDIEFTEGQVSAPSYVFRSLSGLEPLLTEEDGTAGLKLTLECVVPNYDQVAGVTVYRSGILTTPRLQEGFRQQILETRFNIDIGINVIPDFPDATNDMDVVQTYQCETVDLDTAERTLSNPVFVTLSDYEIYSAQLDLNEVLSDSELLWELFQASSTEAWPLAFFSQDQKQALADLLQRLSDAVSLSGWGTYPISFLTSDNPVLVFYIYRQDNPENVEEITSTLALTSLSSLDTAKNEVAAALQGDTDRRVSLREFNLTSLRVVSIAWCWPKKIVEPQTNTDYALPQTRGGTFWKSPETCARDGQAFVTVHCLGDHRVGFQWGPVTINPLCDYSNTTGGSDAKTDVSITLQKLSLVNITKVNVVETIDDTDNITSAFPDVLPVTQDVSYVADILQKTTEVDTLPPTTVKKILDTVSRLSSVQPDTLEEAQNSSSALNRILHSVDELGGKLETNNNDSTSLSDRIVSQDMGLEVWHLADDYDQNHIVGLTMVTGGSSKVLKSEDLVSLFSPDNLDYGGAEVAILLPREFIEAQVRHSNATDVRLVMNVFDDATLYHRAEPSDTNRSLNSKVIAAQLLVDGVPVTDLGPNQLQAVFLPQRRVSDDLRPNLTSCAYWDFSANQNMGGWMTDGCRYTRIQDNRDVCVCDHLTNFAVLLSFYEQDSLANEHQLALSIITIVGLSLSIAGLAITILSFLLIKKLRQGRPQQTLFHLALALLLAWVTFLAGVEQTSSHAGCILVAALLHYLIMASFMWMLMEGILQYLLFVKVMNTYFTNYMIKTAIPAWGIPIIPVAIILAIDTELYDGGDEYCWMSLDAFYYGFAIPVGLIVLANIFIFIMVVISLCRRKDMSKHSSQSSNQTAVNIRASFICFCVLGLSWIFGFLAIEDARIVFQYLFCITGSLQGFIIFLMMTARDKSVRQYWKSWCCCRQASKESTYGWGSSTPVASARPGEQRGLLHVNRH